MNKSYLFFIVHPAKFHLFKETINRLLKNGCKVDVLIISKDVLEDLIKNEGWDYKNLFLKGRKIKYLPSKLVAFFSAILTIIKLLSFIIHKKSYYKYITDDILVVLGYIFNVKSYFFVDNDYKTLSLAKLLLPFTNKIISPSSTDMGKFNYKKISFKGNKAIAHLVPKYFVPNKEKVNIKEDYFFLRLAKLDAVHDDFSNQGINDEYLDKIMQLLLKKGKVVISAERNINKKYEKYKLKINPQDIVHYINYAKIVITDSGTMATEAAVLGVPNILLNNLAKLCGVHVELKTKFALQHYFDNFNDLYLKLIELLKDKDLKNKWNKRKIIFLEYIDDFPELLYKELIK